MTPFLKDLAERSTWTFVQAAAASLVITGLTRDAWLIAAVAGGLAAIKAIGLAAGSKLGPPPPRE
ncbi:MAG: hypothetical protein KJ058_00645 [Thermoanaerobaculia bacterium]|nr:hypothetical protein [Thermoanaerobaculia bacterium]